MKAIEVFTPGAHPTITLVDSHIRAKKQILLDTLSTGSIVVTLSGPSKSGKTVFVEDAVGKGNLIHVTGAGVTEPSILWTRIFAVIGTPLEVSNTSSTKIASSISGKVNGGIPLLASGEAGTSLQNERSAGSAETLAIDVQATLVKELKDTDFVLFIDDFHYISRTAQPSIAETVKEVARQGVKIVLAAVPYRGDDPLRANADLRGRSIALDLGYWEEETLKQIAQRGFSELKIDASDRQILSFVREAAGSPQLMQALCLNACFEAGIRETLSVQSLLSGDTSLFKRVCSRTALMADYRTVADQMREGPRSRGQIRKIYTTKCGDQGDVYRVVLEALAANPPKLTTRYNELMQRIGNLLNGDEPSGSSVTGACEHIVGIANGVAGNAIVEWDGENDVFDIRDPYLLFYLRWSVFPDHI
jgi:hypothetical protein